jgi:ABC-type transporter Mla subunit MlaD
VLFNGFKPLFQALSPSDVNELSYEIIQVFQGQGGTLNGMLAHTASITQTLADRDQVIGQLITNLNSVLAHVGQRNRQLNQLITTFRQFVGGLKKDRGAILGSLDQISDLSVQTADLVSGIRAPFVSDIHHLRGFAANLDRGRPEIDRALQVLPIKLTKVGRTAIYGSWFNFYLCNFTGQIRIGRTAVPVSYNTAPRGATSDELTPRRSSSPPLRSSAGQRRGGPEMSTPFRERNPVVVGAISLAVVLGLILLAFNAEKLPIIGGGDTYYADFSEAGGLKPNDEVRIAGVRVGKVDSVSLDGGHVKVAFRIENGAEFGTDTRAAIKVKTLLGAMFLSLEPAGAGQLSEGSEIPTSRTTSPYDVGGGVLGPRPHLGADRHRPAGHQPDHGWPTSPGTPPRTSGVP